MTIIEDFRTELKTILNGTVKGFVAEDEYFKMIERSGKVLSFSNNIARSYVRAVRILRGKTIDIGKLNSDKELERLLDDFLIEFKYDDEKERMEQVDKYIVSLFDTLKGLHSQKQSYLSGFGGVRKWCGIRWSFLRHWVRGVPPLPLLGLPYRPYPPLSYDETIYDIIINNEKMTKEEAEIVPVKLIKEFLKKKSIL